MTITLEPADQNPRLKFMCPECHGWWVSEDDARLCHGKEPCTRREDCKASSHFGNCESMPSAPSYDALRERVSELEAALKFCRDISEEELTYAKVGTGAEVALRHIARKARENLSTD